MALTKQLPPHTAVEPVTDILHGVTVADPYRWLEHQYSPLTRKWLEEQTTYSRAYFRALAEREPLKKQIEELIAVETVSDPWKVGSRFFYLKRGRQQERAVITMRDINTIAVFHIVYPSETKATLGLAVSIVSISNDARLLAYSARETGRDVSEIRFFDVYKREVLPDRLPSGLLRALVFSPDATGFYYSHEPIEAKRSSHGSVKWHEFGTFADHDHEIFRVNEIPDAHVSVLGSADGTLIYKVFSALDTYTVSIFIHRCQRGESPRKILDGVNGFFFPIGLIKSTLIALTNWRAPNWRVISINIDSAVPDEGKDLVAETGHYITDCSLVDSTLFISSIADLGGQIEGFDLNGRSQCLLPLPDRGTVRLFPRNVPTDTLLYEFSSFGIRPAIFQYQPRTSEHSVWWRSLATPLHTETKTRQLYFSSKDGTNVPVFLISRADQQEKNKLPTFLTAYGGFGKCITPKFAVYMHLLIEQGFLVAVAIIRGGAELGAHWHEAGKRHNRQRAFDDFIAAAEWLIESGYAAAGRIAIGGGSNAGLLVGASMTQRPDLFRAVLCQGPLLDMLRYHLFDHAALWVDEFGRAEDAEDFAALFSYSPYHNVVVGSCYPAVMLISGDADTRCNPMHARKMTARLQSATSSQRPILLDYRPTRGHIPVHALSDRIQSLADRLAFVCHELDVPVHKWGV